MGWETFSYIQVIGFVFLIAGTFVYNDILINPFLRRMGWLKSKVRAAYGSAVHKDFEFFFFADLTAFSVSL